MLNHSAVISPTSTPRKHARAFLAASNDLVDEIERDRAGLGVSREDVLEYLKRRHPAPVAAAQPVRAELPARFRREPDIFLGNVRFGRTRLFLSKLIGDLAWRGVRL